MNFPFSSIVGRRFNPILWPLCARVYHDKDETIHNNLKHCLGEVKKSIGNLPRRGIQFGQADMLLYTDAAYKRRWGRLAAVLIENPRDPPSEWVSHVWKYNLHGGLCHPSFTSDGANYINYLEGVAAVMGIWVFRGLLKNRSFDVLIDNNAAEGALFKMSGKTPGLASSTFEFWAIAVRY